jgi:hypothetical protein
MRIYISGKISGLDYEVAKGYFDLVEEKLRTAGHVPINPCNIVPPNPNPDWKAYMVADIEALMNCDAIIMLENWRDSKGAKIEHAIAEHLGLSVYYSQNHNFF